MSTKVDPPEFRLDGVKWLIVFAGIIGTAVGNYKLASAEVGALFHVLIMVSAVIVLAFIAANTEKGYTFWQLVKSAKVELKKVVWPTRQEVNQTTLLVMVVVLIAAIILWALDAGLGWLASLIIG